MDALYRERELLRRAEKAAHAAGIGFYPYTRELGRERARRNKQRSSPGAFVWSAEWLRPAVAPHEAKGTARVVACGSGSGARGGGAAEGTPPSGSALDSGKVDVGKHQVPLPLWQDWQRGQTRTGRQAQAVEATAEEGVPPIMAAAS